MILRDHAAADDALQQAFEQILRRGSGIRSSDRPLLWLYRVIDRCCFDSLRRRRRASSFSLDAPEGDAAEEPVHPNVDIELRDAAMKLLSNMTDEEKRLAVYLFVDGMSQGEIAQEIGLSRVTVNKHIAALRARAQGYLSGRMA
jgi:RNA polymerase sigma-70 factor (ECF subfamily)